MLKEKTLSQLNKIKIFLEVNSCQVLLYQEIKQVQHLLIEQIKVDRYSKPEDLSSLLSGMISNGINEKIAHKIAGRNWLNFMASHF